MYFKTFFKKTHLLMLLLAIIMPWQMKAQEVVTVCDGTAPGTTTATNSYIPIYGSYVDTQGTTSEFIIPATTEGMDALVGGEISKLTFYISNSPDSWGSPVIQIYMGEVEGTTLSNLYGPTNANVTIVAEKTLSNSQAEMEIELDTPYTYEGGNLLIGTYVKTKSNTYKATNFSGISAPYGSSWYKYSSYGSGSAQSFLPKTTFTYTPAGGMSCAKPSSVTPDDITSNSATIYWTGESDAYNVQYKKSTDTEWIDRATNYSGYSVELTGLESNTSYQVQVQSICEGDAHSSWKLISFETPCEMWTTFPFYENFEDLTTTGEIPGCWDNEDGNVTEVQRWCYSTSNFTGSYGSTVTSGHNGTKCVRFNSYNPTSGKYDCLKTIPMNFPAGKTMQLTFWYKNPTGGDFSVYISTDGGDTYDTSNPLATGLTGQADWTEVEITLPDYVGSQNVAIVFKAISNCGSNNAAVYLDDVTIDEAPNCPKQSGLTATAVTSSSVTLDWTKGTNDQDHWDIFITSDATITPDADTTPTVVNTDEKPYTYNGLNDMTTYYAYVRARCSDTDKSPWTAACKFTTPQIPVTVDGTHPYSTDFEKGCDWLFINGDYTNKWCYGSAANNTTNGTKAIYISNDNGETNAYSSVKSVEYATKNFSFAEGIYTFSFDWRAKGNQYYDFIRVALVPASVELVSTENAPFDATTLPSGWIALDGGSKLNNNESWQTVVADEISVPAGEYMMVFGWRNFTYSVTQPPAAIDNVSISLLTCPRPTNLISNDVTGRTTTLTWTENGSATEWVLEYSTTSDFTGATSVVVNETPSKLLTGLTPETTYYARVKASCSSTDESVWSNVINFTTLATCPKPTLSYVLNSNTAYSGSVSWTGSTADAFEIAYRPTSDFDPSDYTLTDVTRVQLENVSEYTYTLENLTPETKYYIYIQANCGAEDGLSSWSNRVIFTTLATCLEPSYLTDESVTSTSVTLSWTKGDNDQDAWQFRYKKTNESEYTYVLVGNHTENTYTLQGLEPSTSYYVNVRAWCGGDDYSKWSLKNQTSDKTITTACAELKMPYTCDFEGAVETSGHFASYPVPKCWDRIEYAQGSYSIKYYPYIVSNNSHNGSKSLMFYKYTGTADETIILPEIDEQYNMSDLQIRFWAKAGSSNQKLQVGVMEGNTFVQVDEVEDIDGTYAEYTVFLSEYTGQGRNIAIKCGTHNNLIYLYVDDITVELAPTCYIPTALTVVDVDVNYASLTWAAGKDETEWNIQYKKSSESEWGNPIRVTELPTTANPFILTGLKRGTNYDVRVQAYCDADDQSEWCNAISFTTDCGVWPVDVQNAICENFNYNPFPPTCWTLQPSYNGWGVNFNNAMVNDQPTPHGAAHSGTMSSGLVFMILPSMHIEGNAVLSFDQLFGTYGDPTESSIAVTTLDGTFNQFTPVIWTADNDNLPTTRTNVTISLADYNGQDVKIAFKYDGNTTSSRTWYIDNVQVYVADNVFTNEGEWNSSANWSNGTPSIGQSVHIDAPVTIPSGTSIEVNNITVGTGSITIAEGGQLKHNNEDVVATMQKSISGYSRGGEHWYFIAHPMNAAVRVDTETDLTSGTYDLYAFDESKDGEQWRNFKFASNNLTKLEVATGYLYANGTGGTFNVTGTLNPSNVNIEKALTYTSDKVFSGWNLVGNPFACNAYLAGNEAFYRINAEGSAIATTAATGAISPMEGVFVSADSEGSITFTTTAPSSAKPQLAIGLSHNNGSSADNAIIRFDHGNSLRKLVLDESASKLSILQDGEEFAVVNADNQGEIPLYFKAAENGTYTLTVSAPLTFTYLHLIDNKTGNDINLLETPSYSFDARTIDYASRFKLLFSASDNEMVNDFAFISNNELIICGTGTLQVFDILGRSVFTQEDLPLNSHLSTSTFKPGVYMLRLIQGDDVRTQKIVVR